MKTVNTVEFKSKLSQYISEVREGEALYVTSHGHPVVEVRGIVTDEPLGILEPERPVSDLKHLEILTRPELGAEMHLQEDRGRR